ncbi:PREDICTED: TBC1 domain family member 16-like, partial [Eurypyga helias]|uniref:TBC1 domain family member 16-like n=1 Tax=Eurypyga helias TaxID=54383 RepID=UPI0005290B87
MSLGRLLRRASSKASDLLTLSAGGGSSSSPVLDGEIIYSKNNVCVHPPELLQGIGEHHPGYLCLYLEKDELLGTTLILAWVPNSRIQRQDEEALRYITPESSPVHKAPRKRGRHAQGFGVVRQASPTEQRGTVILKEDVLTVSQLVKDVADISSPSSEGERLSRCCPAADGTHRPPRPARSDSGILLTISSQEEQNRSELSLEGTEDGLDCRPEPGEDEGSLELSADDVSRDSTFDSDSDAFSSPFCLSPISEALGKSSSSVFLDNES